MRLKILALLPLVLSGICFAGTCGNSYSKSYKLVIPHQIVPSNQTNFPWPFCFNGGCTNAQSLPDLKTVGNGGSVNNTANNGVGVSGPADVVFSDAQVNGNCLKYSSEAGYSATTGKAKFWVQTQPNSSTDTAIWMFVGNSGVSTTQQDLSLWTDVNYILVCNFQDSSTLSYVCDVGGTGTAIATPTATAGQIDGGIALASASSQAVNMGNLTGSSLTGGGTIESWSLLSSGALQALVSKMDSGSSTSGGCAMYSGDGSTANFTLQCDNGSGLSLVRSSGNRTAGWHYLVGTTTSTPTSTANMKIYDNGVAQSPGATLFNATGIASSAQNLNIGRFPAGTNFYTNGSLDGIRIATDIKTADWITLSYRAQAQLGGSFVVIDANTPAGMSAGANCVPVPIDHTKVPNTDRTNFPFLKVVGGKWMATIANGGYGSDGNGYGIRWYSDSACTSTLSFYRQFYDATSGESVWWVLLPTVSHTSDTTPYVLIGNSTLTADVSSASAVFGANGYVHVMPWGSPTSQSLVSVGSDGITLGATGSPTNTAGPSGAAIFFPVGGTALVNFDPSNPNGLSTYGLPVGSSVRSMVTSFRATTETRAQAVSQTGAALGGYGCAAHSGGCGSGTADTGFSFDRQNPNVGAACGLELGGFDGTPTGAAAYKSCTEFDDYGWHVIAATYTPAAAQINAGTVKLQFDTTQVASPSYLSGTTVPNTSDSYTVPSEIAWGRLPAHSDDFFTGFLGITLVSSNAIDSDTVSTFTNDWLSSQTFSGWGTASNVTPPAVTVQPVITIITDLKRPSTPSPSPDAR